LQHFNGVHVDRSSHVGTASGQSRLRLLLGAVAVVLALAAPAAAHAAGTPKASTGGAREVSFGSAVLGGTLNPNGNDTSYYFQYGPTRAYGGQTAIANAGSGTKALTVRVPVSGLQPLTIYHYRLIAVNSSGATLGGDETLKTTVVPLSLALLSAPNPVSFGGTVIVQGTLSGTNNAGRGVVLQANPFPFVAGFQSTGNTELTGPAGEYRFVVPALTQSTQYRVFTTTNTPVVSAVTTEEVAVRVASSIARAKRHGFARVFGTVTPAADGKEVGILRITRGHGTLVGGTVLRHLNATSSQYSRMVPVKPGVYRVLVRVIGGPQISSYGPPLVVK
jgi:hypothetical protein